jgi:hypothetical protein
MVAGSASRSFKRSQAPRPGPRAATWQADPGPATGTKGAPAGREGQPGNSFIAATAVELSDSLADDADRPDTMTAATAGETLGNGRAWLQTTTCRGPLTL